MTQQQQKRLNSMGIVAYNTGYPWAYFRKCEECETLLKRNEELDIELTLSAKEAVDLHERVDSLLRYNSYLYDKLITVTYKGYQIAGKHR